MKPFNIRITIDETSRGYCNLEGLEEFEDFMNRKDNNDWFEYTHTDVYLEHVVTIDGKDHFFVNSYDLIDFILENTPD
tara:strand:+ start:312 stop:545 length:234 start_codon:yes stop_codon:yes gene_type:complete